MGIGDGAAKRPEGGTERKLIGKTEGVYCLGLYLHAFPTPAFQSMEKAAACEPTSATLTLSRFHSQLSITDAFGPTNILHMPMCLFSLAQETITSNQSAPPSKPGGMQVSSL